jgi:ubiquinone/menaquinone biosynthesis C-methylase UbiE
MAATFNIHLTERIFGSEKRFVNATALIVSACLLLVAISPGVVTVIIAIVLIGGFASARTSYLNTVMNEYIPAEQRATVLSSTSTVNMLIFAIANPIVGYVADHSLRLAFLGVGLLPLIAFFFFRYKSGSKNRNENIAWKGDEPTKVVIKNFEEGVIKPGDKILDIGSGFGRNANWLAQKGVNVTAINIDDEEIREAKEKGEKLGVNVKYIHADATELPFPNDSFDVVLDLGCSHMIHNKEDQRKAETETARVLKPRGHLIYFGFSKAHPDYLNKPNSPMFRDLEDIQEMYGNDFDILSSQEDRWQAKPEEKRSFSEHVGLNIVLDKKG